jgi:hypothetical protein
MSFKMSPSLDPTSQIIGFLPWRLKRQGTQYLDNAFNKETKLDSYPVVGTVRTSAGFLPVLFGSPPPWMLLPTSGDKIETAPRRHASIEANGSLTSHHLRKPRPPPPTRAPSPHCCHGHLTRVSSHADHARSNITVIVVDKTAGEPQLDRPLRVADLGPCRSPVPRAMSPTALAPAPHASKVAEALPAAVVHHHQPSQDCPASR